MKYCFKLKYIYISTYFLKDILGSGVIDHLHPFVVEELSASCHFPKLASWSVPGHLIKLGFPYFYVPGSVSLYATAKPRKIRGHKEIKYGSPKSEIFEELSGD